MKTVTTRRPRTDAGTFLRLMGLCILFMTILQVAEAGNTGKIAGIIKDNQTGEEIVGASVVIEGTSMGAATNVDGYYVILNISPGKYNLIASAVGYNKKRIEGVGVSIDLTTTIDVQLTSTIVEVGEEVVVTAERPLVQKDLTAKTAVVGEQQIASLPVTEVGQILELQAGYVAGSLRGGRSGEVAYWIDGVPVTDVYDGGQVVEVNKDLVQELQLVSGAFNAEYGQAMSGIVNIATKEGGPRFTGSVGVYGGDYLSNHTDIFPGIDDRSVTAIRNIEGNISGPVIGDKLTFFANARYIYFRGWMKGVRRFNPWNLPTADSLGNISLFRDPAGVGDGAIVPMNNSERKYVQGKLTWHVSPVIKASLNYIWDNNPVRVYDSGNDRFRYFYNPDGFGTNYNLSNTAIFQLSHTVSSRTFYTLGGSYFNKVVKYYVYEDPHDPRYTHPLLFTDFLGPNSFYTGGTDLHRFHRSTKTGLAKLDVSSQIDDANLVKVGVEFRRHKIYYESYDLQPVLSQAAFNLFTSSPFIQTQIPDVSTPSYSTYTHRPTEFAAYIQDKLEFKDFILNIGIRFDYFQPDGTVLTDPSDPDIYNPLKPENQFFDQNNNGSQDAGEMTKTVADRAAYWYKKAKAKYQFSPRIGGSFPITDRGVVHFSYGHFFQIPRFERLYENPDYQFSNINQTLLGTVGNADLKPEETVSGEIGVQQQITEDIAVDLTAYLRDIRSLATTGVDKINIITGQSYLKYQNNDFGTIKGIILTVNKRFSAGLSATLDYTYQIARGSGSDPNQALSSLQGGQLPEVQLTPLSWDQTHTLNITMAYNANHWGVSFISQYGSGAPYTPRAATTDITALLTNSQDKPAFFNVDARAFYEIPIDPLRIVTFIRVFNLFDTRNEVNVFDDSGRAGFTVDEQRALNSNPPQLVNPVHQYFIRPVNYSEPRRIELGVNLEF